MAGVDQLKRSLYLFASGKQPAEVAANDSGAPLRLSLLELCAYLAATGGLPLLRGTLTRWRLRRSGPRFFLGRGARLLFPRYLSVGNNVFIGDHAFVNCLATKGIMLGNNVRLREYTWVSATSVLTEPGRGLSIGDNSYIGPGCILGAGGGIDIGRDVTIGARVHILAENHAFDDLTRPISQQGVSRKGIVIGDNCWIGNAAILLDGVHVSEGSVIGAGAVVTSDVPPNSIVVGNPGRVVRERGRPGAPTPTR